MAHLDYITASIPYEKFDLEQLPKHEAFHLATQTIAPRRYETAWLLANGAIIAIPSQKNARQKVLFQMTGDPLAMNRTLGVEDTKLLYWLMTEQRARFSRLDIAFDTVDPASWPERLLWEWRWGQAKTRIKAEPRIWKKEGGGETIYFGSSESLRQMRTYDKAADLDLLAGIITRVELQNRDEMAQHLAGQIINNNELDWTAAAATKALVDFPAVNWYQELLQSGGVTLDKLGRKETDWKKWWRDDIETIFANKARENKNGARLFLRQSIARMKDKLDMIEAGNYEW